MVATTSDLDYFETQSQIVEFSITIYEPLQFFHENIFKQSSSRTANDI